VVASAGWVSDLRLSLPICTCLDYLLDVWVADLAVLAGWAASSPTAPGRRAGPQSCSWGPSHLPGTVVCAAAAAYAPLLSLIGKF